MCSIEKDVDHFAGTTHIEFARRVANDLDALHFIGGDASKLVPGCIVLARNPLAIDQQITSGPQAAIAPAIRSAFAEIEAGDAFQHVVRCHRVVLGEEPGLIDHS